jgi:hypothetical protein
MVPNTEAKAYLARCTARGCTTGLTIDNNGAVAVSCIATCQFEQNTNNGANAIVDAGDTVDVTLVACISSGDAIGVRAFLGGGPAQNLALRVDNCRITGNSSNGNEPDFAGTSLSRGNNTVEGNASANSFGRFSAPNDPGLSATRRNYRSESRVQERDSQPRKHTLENDAARQRLCHNYSAK